ncbi:PH domain-containing protein (plasmid) [Streptomyces sp. NBC_01558]|uniref:PH domain-containing protein n=1 Tax=Streptomyces sp. NBC_01558 TaxID=2975878 RepID=UPI002DDB4D09|nr:PH domain-containing protein [Streptomyces sp. NBC_01558]WSD82709.1 PH domain-containing protein [Streptomyces sp. NBC_01558]
MPDVLIGFSDGARRMSWWRTGLVTLALAIVTVAVGLGERAPDRAWWIAGFGVFSVIVFLGMVSGIYGRVVLTEEGMQFRTLFSRRSIPWSEIAGVETRTRRMRSRTWWELRVVRVRGRALTVPGTATERLWDAELDRKLLLIQQRWSRAAGDSSTETAGAG